MIGLSSYTLIKFFKNDVEAQRVKTPILLCSRTAQKLLCKLEYEYKNLHNDIFIDKHEGSDVIEYCKVFIWKMEELKPYLVEFEKNDAIKPKVYLLDCTIRGNNRSPIILINYDECESSANDRIQRAWA